MTAGDGRTTPVRRLGVYTDYIYHRSGTGIYAERAFALFLTRLATEFDEMVIVGKIDPQPGRGRYRIPDDIRFVELPFYASMTAPASALAAMAKSIAAFWRALSDVDRVWLLGPHPLGVAFVLLARLRRTPVTLGVRQDFPVYVRARHPHRRWTHAVGDALEAVWRRLARTRSVIAVGPSLAAGYPQARTLEIAVSLVRDEDVCCPEDVAGRSFEEPELRALSVGRLEEEKNPLLLADALAGLCAADPRWRLLICGEGPLEAALRDRLSELKVADRATLMGYVPLDSGLRDLYRSSHVLLHISWTEGVPQVLFEAFAARLPVAATAVGGVVSVAEAAVTFGPGDADAAVSAVERLRTDRGLRERLVARGVDLVSFRTLDAEVRRVAAFLGR